MQTGGPEQGIANGVDEDIGIRMTCGAFIVSDLYPTKPEIFAGLQLVRIKSKTYAHRNW
jgi:hypothetical protein